MEASIFLTYRCNAHCKMCNTWKYPTKREDELDIETIKKLPDNFSFINLAGGEPFIREDIEEIVEVLSKKTKRIVISTNGYYTDKIVSLVKRFPKVGIRISIEGLPKVNDEIRGIENGFDRALRTLLKLREMGSKDIGFAMTVSDDNAKSLLELYDLMDTMGMEFATSSVHNSFFFHKDDNVIKDPEMVAGEFDKLSEKMLRSRKPKQWARAYYNYGVSQKIRFNKRLYPCTVGTDSFRIDPFGNVIPCEGMACKMEMGNLKEQSFEEIWNSERAKKVREAVKVCKNNCWMVPNAIPVIKKHPIETLTWIVKEKISAHLGINDEKDILVTGAYENMKMDIKEQL